MGYAPSRTDDDRVLAMLQMRQAGGTLARVAEHYGLSRPRVAKLTDAVRKADVAESGENELAAASHYWPLRGSDDARR